jgi:hypothetical protein
VIEKLGQGEVLFAAGDAVSHRNPGLVHRLGISRFQRMPPGQIAALGDETVGASRRQPRQLGHVAGREPDAVGHLGLAVVVIAAPAGAGIKQRAANVGVMDGAALLVLELDETAAGAAVTEALPFRRRHLAKALRAPERASVDERFGGGHAR